MTRVSISVIMAHECSSGVDKISDNATLTDSAVPHTSRKRKLKFCASPSSKAQKESLE